jgi:hypothetical protein
MNVPTWKVSMCLYSYLISELPDALPHRIWGIGIIAGRGRQMQIELLARERDGIGV